MKATNPKWAPAKDSTARTPTTGKAATAGTEGKGTTTAPRASTGKTDTPAPTAEPGGTPKRSATPPTTPTAAPADAGKKPPAAGRAR